MAAVTVNTERVQPVFEDRSDVRSYIFGETIDYGDPVFIQTTTGKILKSDASAVATAAFAGYSLSKGGAGQSGDVIHKGTLPCFDLSSLARGAETFVGNGGGTADAAGTTSVSTGRVNSLSDPALTKVLEVNVDLTASSCYAAGA